MASNFLNNFMASAAPFLASRFSQPIPTQLSDEYAARKLTAQNARGSGGSDTNLTGEDTAYLEGLAEKSRHFLLASDVKISGLAQKQTQFEAAQALQQSQWSQLFKDTKAAGASQSAFADKYFSWLRAQVPDARSLLNQPKSNYQGGNGGGTSMYYGSAFTGATI